MPGRAILPRMKGVVRFGVAMEGPLLDQFDAAIHERGYATAPRPFATWCVPTSLGSPGRATK